MNIGGVDVVSTAKATFKEFRKDDLQELAAGIAYHLLFSIVPLLIFLTALSGFISKWVGIDDAMNNVTDWLFDKLPAATATAVADPIREVITNQSGGFLSIGALLALWGAKNAVASIMKALNVAFGVDETRPWVRKTGISLGLTVALGLAVVAASAFFLVGSVAGDTVAGWIGVGSWWTTLWSLLRWPLIVAVMIMMVAFFLWVGPNTDTPFKWVTPGAIVTVVLWGLVTLGLGFYFAYFASYAETYGALGGVLAFVFWLYVMSLVLLIGGEVNSVLAKQAGVEGDTEESQSARDDSTAVFNAALERAKSWPSIESEARQALAAEPPERHRQRYQQAVRALGVSAAAAISGIVLGAGRR